MSHACIKQWSAEGESNMPEWKQEIRRRLVSLRLEPAREAAIVVSFRKNICAMTPCRKDTFVENRRLIEASLSSRYFE